MIEYYKGYSIEVLKNGHIKVNNIIRVGWTIQAIKQNIDQITYNKINEKRNLESNKRI